MPSRSSMGRRPGPAASTRRSATVTICVPEATMAAPSAAGLDAPPVPRMRRDSPSRSATLGRREHLDPVAVVQRRRGPAAPRHDLAVDGDGDAPAGLSDQVGDGAGAGELLRLPVDDQVHANLLGLHASGAGVPVMTSVTMSAVSGASSTP